jgi:hypothetical protein
MLEIRRLFLEFAGIGKDQIEHALRVGLHVAAIAPEEPMDCFAVFLFEIFEQDVVAVGKHRQEVPFFAGLAPLLVACNGLDAHARRVRRDAERPKRVQVHRLDDRHREPVADELLPSREGASIDWDPLAVKRVFKSEQRHPLADVLHDDVRRERRRRDRAWQHLRRHRCRDDVRIAFRVDRLVPNARGHDPHLARAPVRKFARLFEPMALDFPFGDEFFEVRVGDLDAHFFDRKLAEIPPPRPSIVRALAATLAVFCRCVVIRLRRFLGNPKRLGHRIQLAHLRGELEFELSCVVDALGLRDEEPALEELELLSQPLVRRAQIVPLFLELSDPLRGCRALGVQ